MAKRKPIPPAVETAVLTKSRRRCCLCFHLNGDVTTKKGQIAHLDGDRANANEDNLAFLCWPHHDEYDSRTSQSKGLTIGEAKHARDQLYKKLEQAAPNDLSPAPSASLHITSDKSVVAGHIGTVIMQGPADSGSGPQIAPTRPRHRTSRKSLPERRPPWIDVVPNETITLHYSFDHAPLCFSWDLPGMSKKIGSKADRYAKHWKAVHALSEKLYISFRNVHLPLVRYSLSGDDRERESADTLLEVATHNLNEFCTRLLMLPNQVKNTEHIVVLLKLPKGVGALRRGVTFQHDHPQFRCVLQLVERICAWSFDCLTRADLILEWFFESRRRTR